MTARRQQSGSLSVELMQAKPRPEWAVVRWQNGAMRYRPIYRTYNENVAYETLDYMLADQRQAVP